MKTLFSFLTLPLILLTAANAQPSSDKDNIIIASKKESFEYKLGDKKNPVVVKTTSVTKFQCNQFRASLHFSETYNDMVTMDKVSPGKAGIQPSYNSLESNGIFYSDAKVCYFTIPFSKKGETCEVKIQQTYLNPRYFTTIYFPEKEFVSEKEVEIVIPKWMKVELKEMNFAGHTIQKTSAFDSKRNADVYVYKIKNIPGMKSERNAPGPTYIYPHIMVLNKEANIASGKQTYFATLDDQYAWYRGLVKEVKVDDAVMKETAQRLTKNCKTDIEKIKTIFEWVQSNVRYIAFEDGLAGFKPAAPQEVLSKKYGDCKGKAILTKELLKALEFDARLAWIGTNHIAYDYSTPSLAVDNHMICALFFDKHLYYLDATEEYIGFDEYAQRIQGRQVLIEDGEKYLLERVPERMPEQNTEVEKSFFQINNGNLAGKVEISYKGEEKEAFLTAVYGTKKDKLNDALTEYLRQGNSQYSILELKHSEMNAGNEFVSLSYNTETKVGIQQYDKEYYIDLDFRKEFLNSRIDTAKRKLDFVFPYKCHVIHETELTIPSTIKVESLPEGLNIARDGYRFTISYSQKSGKVIYRKEIVINNILLPRSRFSEWNRDIDALKKAYLDQISLITK